ncbi:MAG: hypothetical protein K5694_02290 [Bacilli bacterium]|nr:hypothetical protein [Bacilli bacterium]
MELFNKKRVEAVVGIAKCPKTGKLYGVRIDSSRPKWIATWAFEIDDAEAKREKYTANVFPPDLQYDKEYPGCPYCHTHEDLFKISQINAPVVDKKPKKAPKIYVTTANYDNIGAILHEMKIPFSGFNGKFDCDILFINCGTNDDLDVMKLRDFVKRGGCVYASDLASGFLIDTFGELFDFEGNIGEVGTVPAKILDPELRKVAGDHISIYFDLPIWSVLREVKGETLISGGFGSKYHGVPIMVKVPYGEGTIFYTSFHNYAQASKKEKALLELLILKQIGSRDGTDIEEAGKAVGFDIDKIKATFKKNF